MLPDSRYCLALDLPHDPDPTLYIKEVRASTLFGVNSSPDLFNESSAIPLADSPSCVKRATACSSVRPSAYLTPVPPILTIPDCTSSGVSLCP